MLAARKLTLGLALCAATAACSPAGSATTAPSTAAPTTAPVATTPATATQAPATQAPATAPGNPTAAFAVFAPKAGGSISVTGGATLAAGSGKTDVVIAVVSSSTDAMAASIQAGTCDALTPEIAYRLTEVKSGASTTSVPVDLATLLATPYSINISVAGSETESSITCGEIKPGIAP